MTIVSVNETLKRARNLHRLMKENANGIPLILTDIEVGIQTTRHISKRISDTEMISEGCSLNDYQIGKLIGCGGYEKVFLATKDKKNVAIKVRENKTDRQKEQNLHESFILSCISARKATEYLVQCFDTIQHGPNFCYVMEKLDVSLNDYLKMSGMKSMKLQHVQQITYEVLSATAALSDIGFLHLDIKPANILFCNIWNPNDAWKIKLCDFGLSISVDKIRDYSGCIQTINYRAPEVILGLPLSDNIDSWSIGCILFRIYSGFVLFAAHDELEMLRQIEIITGLPENFKDGYRISQLYTQSENGELLLKSDSNTKKFDMHYTKRGFEELEKFGDNYKTTGSFTEMDSVIVRLINSLLQPDANMRINAAYGKEYLKFNIDAFEDCDALFVDNNIV